MHKNCLTAWSDSATDVWCQKNHQIHLEKWIMLSVFSNSSLFLRSIIFHGLFSNNYSTRLFLLVKMMMLGRTFCRVQCQPRNRGWFKKNMSGPLNPTYSLSPLIYVWVFLTLKDYWWWEREEKSLPHPVLQKIKYSSIWKIRSIQHISCLKEKVNRKQFTLSVSI